MPSTPTPPPAPPATSDPSAVTVLIAVYNAAPFIEETLASVRAQSERPAQILVVDDGSTDGSADILRRQPDIRLLTHPGGENRGQAASLQVALAGVTTPYVAILDADDCWTEDKLAVHLRVMRADPALALTYSDGWVVDHARSRLWPLLPAAHVESHDVNALLLNNYIRHPSSVVLRTDALVACGGLTPGLIPWDHDLWLRIAERHRIDYIPKRLSEYRQHGSQLSRSRRQWEDGARVLAAACARHAYARRAIRQRRAVLCFRLGEHDLAHRHRLRGAGYLIASACLDPARALRVLAGKSR